MPHQRVLSLVKSKESQIIPQTREIPPALKQLNACLSPCMFPRKNGNMRIELSVDGLTSNFFNLFAENWNHLEKISDDTIVSHIENGCLGIFIDGQNHF